MYATIDIRKLLGISFILLSIVSPAQARYGGGSGEHGDPFLICTAEQMNTVGLHEEDWDKHFKLMADVDLSMLGGARFNIIGHDYENPFMGLFDGNGHTISHLTITAKKAYAGLFGRLLSGAEVRDLGLADVRITGSPRHCRVAALVAFNNGNVVRCHSSGVVGGTCDVGGLIGSNHGDVTHSYSTCTVSGDESVGGLVGFNYGNIDCCYSSGGVDGNNHIGGLVGYNGHKGDVTRCYSIGVVSGGSEVGGLTGGNWGRVISCYSTSAVSGSESVGGLVGNNEHTIRSCYATGGVAGTVHIGGLVGSNNADVTNSFWDTLTSGQTNSAGGTGKTTAEMQVSSTFFGWGGWDDEANGAWTIDEGNDYPRLLWEDAPGHAIAPTPQLLTQATNPHPADGALHEDPWANLRWTPGDPGVSHEIYFGDDFDGVNSGAKITFRGRQTGTCFAVGLPGHPYGSGLVPGATYYWRIDEIDEKQAYGTERRGDVWSFTVACNLAHHPNPPDGALAVTAPLLQWKPATSAVFHDVYLGTNPDLTETDLVGPRQPWTMYYHVPGLQPGARYYWRVDEIEADGTVHTGDLWTFLARDAKAYHPGPADGANDVSSTPELTWLPGTGAAEHYVYFGDSAEAVGQGAAETGKGILTDTTFAPGELEPLSTYYWRVDEIIDDGSIQTGEVWRFATYLTVDDFESYTDEEGERFFETWIDGWEIPANGAIVGYIWVWPEQAIVHSGCQAMPFSYDNSGPAHYSEACREWNVPQDWTVGGVSDLSLWIRGRPVSFLEQPDGVVVMSGRVGHGEGCSEGTNDEYAFAYKQLAGDGEIVARVESLSGADCWTRAGVMVRENLDYGSPYAAVTVTAACGVSFAHCPVKKAKSVQINHAGPNVPHWVNLIRRDNAFTAQHSEDGLVWYDVTNADGEPVTANVAMAESVYMGLCASSQSQRVPAVFSHIAMAGTVVGQWQMSGSWYGPPNSPDDLYVALQDSAGGIGVSVHPDPMAVNVDRWTQWKIGLDQFSSVGVDLTSIRKMYIGVGDRNNPQPDGTGRIWIDDIRLMKRTP